MWLNLASAAAADIQYHFITWPRLAQRSMTSGLLKEVMQVDLMFQHNFL